MATTPHQRRYKSQRTETTTSPSKRADGLFKDNTWWCNCDPRKKAILREVQKATSPNKGRLFYKCNAPPYCNFFLWRSDSKMREKAAMAESETSTATLATTATVTPRQKPPQRPPSLTQQGLGSFGFGADGTTSAQRTGATAGNPSHDPERNDSAVDLKRKRANQPSNGDDDEFESLGSDEERELADFADTVVQLSAGSAASKQPQTPTAGRGAATVQHGLVTPSVSRTLFPQSKTTATGPSTSSPDTLMTPQQTPTNSSMTLAGPSNNSSSSSDGSGGGAVAGSAGLGDVHSNDIDDIKQDIMSTLQGDSKIGKDTAERVQELLQRASRRIRGVALGRETARSLLRERDTKVARLLERVAALENKERMHNAKVVEMKSRMMEIYDEH